MSRLREPARMAGAGAAPDERIVERVLAGDRALFEILMRRYNQRLFRTVRAILGDDASTEDVLQEAYVRAYQNLDRFEGRARFSTWLTRIAIHEALRRKRRAGRFRSLDAGFDERPPLSDTIDDERPNPEQALHLGQLHGVLDHAIRSMPETLRVVFMLREVHGLDTAETAACLGISAANVKVRLHRARSRIRSRIDRNLARDLGGLHAFAGERCDSMVERVLARILADAGNQGDAS